MKFSNERTDWKVLINRKMFFSKIKIDLANVVSAEAVHGNKIKVVNRQDAGKVIKNVDGLITDSKKVFLAVTVADCLPIYLFDSKTKVIGLLHAGWRGLEKNIIENAIKAMIKKFKVKLAHLEVWIGPYIKSCHYRVRNDLINKFSNYPEALIIKNNKYFIDLACIAKQKFIDTGVNNVNIKISLKCAHCLKDKYYSYRRDKPKRLKAMVAYIGQRI